MRPTTAKRERSTDDTRAKPLETTCETPWRVSRAETSGLFFLGFFGHFCPGHDSHATQPKRLHLSTHFLQTSDTFTDRWVGAKKIRDAFAFERICKKEVRRRAVLLP